MDSLRFLNVEVYVFANVGKVLVFKIFSMVNMYFYTQGEKKLLKEKTIHMILEHSNG